MVQATELVALYPPSRAPDAERLIDIILIAGIGTAQPQNWNDNSSSWIQTLVTTLSPGDKAAVQVWSFQYSLDRSTAVMPQIFSKAQELLKCVLNSFELNDERKARPLIFICHSLGGLILKRALCSARKFHRNILYLIENIIFLSTPHIGRESQLEYNIVELVLRSNQNIPGRNEVKDDDNKEILKICVDYEKAMLPIPALLVFESVPTKLQGSHWNKFRKQKHPSQTIVVGETLVSFGAKGEEVYSMDVAHNDTCKIIVDGPIYLRIHQVLLDAVNKRAAMMHNDSYTIPDALKRKMERIESHNLDLVGSPPWAAVDFEQLDLQEVPELQAESAAVPSIQAPVPSRSINLPLLSYKSIERNPGFFGRQDVLKLIDKYLLPVVDLPPSALSTFALCGMGGLGKTQIAIEYLLSRAIQFDAVIWLSADDKTILAQSMARIAIDLGLESEGEGAQNLTLSCDRVLKWLANPVKVLDAPSSEVDRARWLIVFDNADDLKTLDDYWPTKGVGSVLVTSRDPKTKNYFQGRCSGIDLSPLSIEDGARFMEQLTQGQPLANSDNSLQSVSELLGGLPLAITQMAHIMVDLRLTSYGEFLDFYKQAGVKKLYKMEGEEQQFGDLGYNRTLATVWALDRLAPEALALFRVISLLDPDKIPEVILNGGSIDLKSPTYPKDFHGYLRARAQLIKSSLITVNDKQRELIVHRVVQDETRAEMDKETFHDTFEDALKLVVKVWPFQTLRKRHDLARKERCEKLFTNIIRLKRVFDDVPEELKFQPNDKFADLLNDLGWYLLERGFVQESKTYYQLAQHICENSPNKDTEEVSLTLRMAHNNQTTAAAETNERKDCLDHSLIWMKMFQERKTPDGKPLRDYELGIVYNETGVAYGMNEEWGLAEDYFLKSIQVMKEQENYEDTMLGWPEPNLGLIYWIQGRYDEAETVLNEILDIQALAFGVDDTQSFKTGKILHALGNLLWSQGRMNESLDHHQRAVDQYMVTLGAGHHRTADVRHRLAMHYLRLNRLNEAEIMIDEALDVFKSGPYHKPEVARSSFKKSQILKQLGREKEAKELFKTAVQLRKGLVPKCSKPVEKLTDEDFDVLPIFWSR